MRDRPGKARAPSRLFIGRCARNASWLFASLGMFVGCQSQESLIEVPVGSQIEASQTGAGTVLAATPTISPVVKWIDEEAIAKYIPDWAAEAVFYQIFPERFRNGDVQNDPTRDSLEDPASVPENWRPSVWTSDWYARSDWEQQLGDKFFEHGVFDRRYGGDLQGIIDKLDYLSELGINAIYLNPVFYGKSLHKYDLASMHHVDPYFGPDPAGDLEIIREETGDPETWHWTAADKLFLELVQEAHRRKIRIIIDGVFNHTGRAFFAFADILAKQQDSPYRDWYLVESFDDPDTGQNELKYKSWWGYESLPEFADSPSGQDLHQAPKKYIFDITRRWMDPDGDGNPDDGIDGWRLDVANEVPIGFWRDWSELVRQLNPEAYTVGEFWNEALDHLIEGQFSATMNYHGFAYLVKGFLIDGELAASEFGRLLADRRQSYPRSMQYALQNLIDSHDTDRVASMIVNAGRGDYLRPERFDFDVSERAGARNDSTYDVRRPNVRERKIQRLVATMQMTYVGAPMVYYGTEAGMWGGDDPCDRMPMVWQDLVYNDQQGDPLGRPRKADPVGFDAELFDFYRRAIQLRTSNPVLSHGEFELVGQDDTAKFFAFRRRSDKASLLVAFNRGDEPFRWQLSPKAGDAPRQLLSTADESEIGIQAAGEHWSVTIPALTAIVWDEHATGE
ncbi:MAG: DUF3459 domain-containing protein [Planctomycetales bacterium]|nr:DUF3459 domain-containing protein [Planctomycetales bacterium]